jgi:hypothetical protein
VNELKPILGEQPTEAEARLLRSARLDVPPASGKGRALAAVGLAAAMTTAAGTGGATAAAVTVGVVVKWVALGAVGSAIALGAVEELRPGVPDAPRHRSPLVAAPVAVTVPVAPPAGPPPSLPSSLASQPEPEPVESAEPAQRDVVVSGSTTGAQSAAHPPRRSPPDAPMGAPTERPLGPPPAEVSPAAGATLAAELSALDDARQALASGDADGALRTLDGYDRRFARRRLGPEAIVLRLEALVAQGRWDQARHLGRELLAAEPDGAYAQRVRSILASTPR